jgi:hypothetical protein
MTAENLTAVQKIVRGDDEGRAISVGDGEWPKEYKLDI